MDKNKDSMDAFDLVASELSSFDLDDIPENLKLDEDEEKEDTSAEMDQEEELDTKTEEVTEEEETPKKEEESKDNKEEDLDLGEYEEDIAKYVSQKLESKLGFDLGEFKSVDEIVDGLTSVVEESINDAFASDEIKELNDFVRNGGKLKEFYAKVVMDRVDPSDINIDKEEDQKRIVRQNLKDNGYTDSQIERKLERYEDLGTLRDEAEEAMEIAEESSKKTKEKLLAEAQKQAEESKKRQQKFVTDVQKVIKDIKDIRGIPVSDVEKKEMFKALFVPESDGKTKFQKVYESDVRHLIESVFFTLKGDVLIKRAQTKGSTQTVKSLKDKISQKTNRIKKSVDDRGTSLDLLDAFSGMLTKRK